MLSVSVAAHDDDGDVLTYQYQWLKNGGTIAGETGATLDLAVAGKGDKDDLISVRVVAFDGLLQSAPLTSPQVAIANSPPTFDQNLGDRSNVEGDAVSLAATATDPDDDALSYEATGLPPDLSINATTGLISGTIANGAASGSPYAVVVSMGEGLVADATHTFSWTVTAAPVPPVVVPGAVSTLEGDAGSHTVNVPVTLNHVSSSTVTVEYVTFESAATNAAKAPGDYVATSGTVTFDPGETSAVVPVVINGDLVREAEELVLVSFRNASGATIGGYLGLGFAFITNDDPLPVLVPGSVSTLEGNVGSHTVNVPVTLNPRARRRSPPRTSPSKRRAAPTPRRPPATTSRRAGRSRSRRVRRRRPCRSPSRAMWCANPTSSSWCRSATRPVPRSAASTASGSPSSPTTTDGRHTIRHHGLR